MPPTQNFLQSFLHTSRTTLVAATKTTNILPIVIGNESADLDSFASSLLYAYLTPTRPQPIPFLAIPRADLSLRPEFLHLFHELSLSPSDILCADDTPSFHSVPPSALHLHLVDHNVPTLPLPGSQVVGIIDHHDDEGHFPSASPRVIEKCGSCSSLVIRTFLAQSQLRKADEQSQIARLALAAVLIDTTDMTQKVTEIDEAVVQTLLGMLPKDWDRKAFYQGVSQAKKDVGSLPLRDLLRKDYKEWAEANVCKIGIASVVMGLKWMCSREENNTVFMNCLKSYAGEKGLDVLGVMTTDGEGDEFHRELLLWGMSDVGKECVQRFENGADDAGLSLGKWGDGELDLVPERKAWTQGNLAMSRKQVAPFLRECARGRNDTNKARAKV
ncbi:hypothetical protein BZA05DRAFT_335152 [Tricharina praecox]|uniref:uncharacterized protein n=1 Tax=Tricharina praecox TaxID=43433 RepID=UPI0022202F5E|nr:uncharacterized protein BZA05DRAFT_335152 [Tricharina praecox]KAI5854191.1 hypothetical protein BZA05DRAFT_335152 [Tricharina praecox]